MAEATTTMASPERPGAGDRVPTRLAVFIAGLVLALVAGFGLGRVVGAAPSPAGAPSGDIATTGHTHAPGVGPHDDSTAGAAATSGTEVGGLAVSAGGYRLVPENTTFPAGRAQVFRFRVLGPDGAPATSFAVLNDKSLHLIVVRRDLAGYQHLHPTMAPDGVWSVPLTLTGAGVWRAYADFAVAGGAQTPMTLGVDLTVTGVYQPRPLPAAGPTTKVAGFDVAYNGAPAVGSTQPVLFTVTQAGAPVTPQRYLGAYGHLVVLREGDLGYVHVHPENQLAGGTVKFWLAVPSAGRYRMFFDFQLAAKVHTAEFTLVVG